VLEVGGRGVGRGDNGPTIYGPEGIRTAAMAEKRGLRASRGEGEADTGGGFDDASAKLQ